MRFPRWLRALLFLALLATFVGVRVTFLMADPPARVPNGRSPHELVVEPIAKAHEARNWALFGSFSTNPVDNYQFWRPQAPAWVYPLALYFRLVGTSTLKLRIFALVSTCLGYLIFLWLARLRLRGLAFAGAALLLGFNCYWILYTRVGLLEPHVIGLVTLSAVMLVVAERRPLALVVAQLAFAAAFFTKQSAAFFFPVLLIACVRRQWRFLFERERSVLARALPIVTAVAILALTLFVIRTPGYQRAIAWNFGHVVLGETQHQTVAVEKVSGLAVLLRPFSWQRWQSGYFLLFPVAGSVALLRALTLLPGLVRRRLPVWEAVVLGYFLCALAATMFAQPEGNRFELILYPPVCLLAGSAFLVLRRSTFRGWRRPIARALPALALLGALGFHGYFVQKWVRDRKYQMNQTSASVARLLDAPQARKARGGKPAVVIGLWAGPLVFDTKHIYYYVKENFNASKDALIKLSPTNMLLFDRWDPARGIMTYHFPKRMKSLPKPKVFHTPRGKVSFYTLDKPLP